jgi:hypothetical protein
MHGPIVVFPAGGLGELNRRHGKGRGNRVGLVDVFRSASKRQQPASNQLTLCGRTGCESHATVRCQYVDPVGRRCDDWCSRHVVVAAGRTYCERHYNMSRQMTARAGTIYELKERPVLDDRRATLVAAMVDDLDPDVRQLLAAAFLEHVGARIITDTAVREARRTIQSVTPASRVVATGRNLSWTRGWAVCNSQGYLCRVNLEVPEGERTVVSLSIDGQVVYSGTPDLISQPTGQDHPSPTGFRNEVLAALVERLDGRGVREW